MCLCFHTDQTLRLAPQNCTAPKCNNSHQHLSCHTWQLSAQPLCSHPIFLFRLNPLFSTDMQIDSGGSSRIIGILHENNQGFIHSPPLTTLSQSGPWCLSWKHWVWGGNVLWMRHHKIYTHLHTWGQFRDANPPTSMFLGDWRKLVNPEETLVNTRRTCKTQTVISSQDGTGNPGGVRWQH